MFQSFVIKLNDQMYKVLTKGVYVWLGLPMLVLCFLELWYGWI
jgi:hypothetical protein